MDKSLLVKFANEHGLNADAIARFSERVFEAGQKNGIYHVLRRVDEGWASLDDVAVNELSYGKVALIEMLAQKVEAASAKTFLRERLDKIKETDEKAKAELAEIEARSQALLRSISKGEEESEVLSELLKEIG
jgi:tRNA G18 (ribose-2'-O)-methylase SpoU